MSKHRPEDVAPKDARTVGELTAPARAKGRKHHPAGSRFVGALAAVGFGVAVLAAPAALGTSTASARPQLDQPVVCGPGYTAVGARCVGKGIWKH